jgi:hypothetical protein
MQSAQDNQVFSNKERALFLDCPRCFYLEKYYGVHRPSGHTTDYQAPEESHIESQGYIDEMQRILKTGPPLPSMHCSYCNYRQRVRETGVENDLSG